MQGIAGVNVNWGKIISGVIILIILSFVFGFCSGYIIGSDDKNSDNGEVGKDLEA